MQVLFLCPKIAYTLTTHFCSFFQGVFHPQKHLFDKQCREPAFATLTLHISAQSPHNPSIGLPERPLEPNWAKDRLMFCQFRLFTLHQEMAINEVLN
jgi:hypothetical protein